MKVLVILLVLIGFTSSVFAFEPVYTDYFSNPEFQKYSIVAENYRYEIPYDMSTGIIESMKIECEWTILTLNIQSNDNGDLTIHLPRSLIDSKSGTSSDDVFIVLLDGKEIAFEEGTDSASRTLKIPFEQDTSIIKIIGVNYPEHSGYNACNGKHNPPYSYWFPPTKQIQSGIPFEEIQCKDGLVLVQKYDGTPACVTESTKQKLIERGWVKSEDHPFGLRGPVMNQETCNSFVISQWQPTVEGKEKVQKFLEICIQRGFTTPELVERGKVANNFTTGSIQSAQKSAKGDLEKTIEILEEMYRENEN